MNPIDCLTNREREVFLLYGRGMSREEIAKTIFRSPKTVDTHRRNIMEKLGVNTTVKLALLARDFITLG